MRLGVRWPPVRGPARHLCPSGATHSMVHVSHQQQRRQQQLPPPPSQAHLTQRRTRQVGSACKRERAGPGGHSVSVGSRSSDHAVDLAGGHSGARFATRSSARCTAAARGNEPLSRGARSFVRATTQPPADEASSRAALRPAPRSRLARSERVWTPLPRPIAALASLGPHEAAAGVKRVRGGGGGGVFCLASPVPMPDFASHALGVGHQRWNG
mmetsp:Transcript_16135/g.27526  ORF Transcript_16135/g.27526 Transcript_16135/m.27526 type:complete len:213 (-) Transcript_16135:406-1044(-)